MKITLALATAAVASAQYGYNPYSTGYAGRGASAYNPYGAAYGGVAGGVFGGRGYGGYGGRGYGGRGAYNPYGGMYGAQVAPVMPVPVPRAPGSFDGVFGERQNLKMGMMARNAQTPTPLNRMLSTENMFGMQLGADEPGFIPIQDLMMPLMMMNTLGNQEMTDSGGFPMELVLMMTMGDQGIGGGGMGAMFPFLALNGGKYDNGLDLFALSMMMQGGPKEMGNDFLNPYLYSKAMPQGQMGFSDPAYIMSMSGMADGGFMRF